MEHLSERFLRANTLPDLPSRWSGLLLPLLWLAFLLPQQAQAQTCSLTLRPTVSGCYSVSGSSKATVSVEVTWANATVSNSANDASDAIMVSYAGQTRSVNPGPYTTPGSEGTIISPQVVAFEVDLPVTASGQAVAVSFINAASCSALSGGVTLPTPCPPTVCAAGQTGGTVFNDFNADGVKNPGETTGVPGVVVRAYDCNNQLVGTTTTDVFGIYSFTGLTPASYPIRVEFVNLPAHAGMGTPNGTDGNTTIQFVNTPDCTIDLGILDNNDYCQTNPQMIIPCYVYGDPLVAGGGSAASDAVVSFDYNLTGLMDMTKMAHAPASEVGTVWGMAYNKFTKKVFSSATVKRHAGLGPLGLGGIYVADFTTVPANGALFNYSSFIDVSTIGINVGTIADNATRGLVADKTQPSVDNQGYLAAGKIGIGSIDLSEDGNKLYLTNLFDNKLYEIDITAYNTNGALPTAANVNNYEVSAGINCTGGNARIWAVKVYKGKVYTGFVCDAGISQNKSDLRAYIQELDGNTVKTVFDFPLTYPKGFPAQFSPSITGWYPWTDDWNAKIAAFGVIMIHPEPMLSAIEFDIDGSMIIGFGDRTGVQTGHLNYNPNGNDGNTYSGIIGGDILRAYSNGTTFVLESNAKAGPSVGYGENNNQGPGFGEFYNDDWSAGGFLFHTENALGGLAVRPGSGEVIEVAMDPVDLPGGDNTLYANAGGIRRLSNQTGQQNGSYQIYTSNLVAGTFGKATGLGDVVFNCDVPTYLEIGNRVWNDANANGIQDACEKALSGVLVSLYNQAGTTLIASTTTNANGEYYFNNNPVSSTVAGTVSSTMILPNTAYVVRFGTNGITNQYDGTSHILTVDNGKYNLTTAFSTTPTANTLNDSNAQLSGGFVQANITTGPAGSVNHTIDAGFICAPTTIASVSVVKTTYPATSTVANSDGQILLSGIVCADRAFLVATGGTLPSYTATGSQPVSNSAVSFTGLVNPATGAGQSYSIVLYNGPCCYTVVSTTLAQQICVLPSLTVSVGAPVCNTATNQYMVTGTVSLTNAPAGTLTITDNGSSVAVVSVTAGQSSVSFSVSGTSNASNHTVVATLANGLTVTANTTYQAPASCTFCSLSITTSALTSGTVGVAYSQTVGLSGAVGSPIFTVSGSLPAGLSLNAATGVISGTPSAAGASGFTISVTDGKNCSATVPLTVTVSCPNLTASISGNLSICAGTATTLTASGGARYLWSTGQQTASISVSVAGPYSVTATSTPGCSATANAMVVVSPLPSISATSATICGGQTATLTVSGAASYEWSNGAQTPSILVSPTATQDYSVTGFTAQGCSTTVLGTVTVNGQPQINSISQSPICVGTVSSLTVNATNAGAGMLEYSLNGGAFQTGNSFTLNAPSSTTAVIVVRTQGSSCTATESVVVNCACQTPVSLTFVPTTLQTCAGQAVSFTLGVAGATSATLTSSGSGTLSQSVITSGSVQSVTYRPALSDGSSVTLTLTSADPDGVGSCVADQVVRVLTISPTPSVSATSASICAGGTAMLMASGASIYRWSTGETTQSISVSVAGAYSVTGTSAQGCSATATGSLTVYPTIVISPTSLPAATVGLPYSQTISATGGVPAYSFSVVAGSLPAGLSLNSTTGMLSGTPTSAAPASFTIKVTDSKGCSAVQPYSSTIVTAALGDYVFEDVNANGIQDGPDRPIAGVTVTLLSSGTVVATTTTNVSGLYNFTGLTPGVPYSVSFSAPAGFSAPPQTVGVDRTIDSNGDPVTGLTTPVTLTANENNITIDMGYFRSASLGDKVFTDNNRNGIQDAGDTPIPNVMVTLLSNGTVVATMTTLTSGTGIGCYSFTGLTPGVPYSVSFTTPAGYTATTPLVGNDRTVDSDPVGGITAPVTLTSGENNPTLDAGFILLDNLQILSSTVCAGIPASLTLLGCTGSIQWTGANITAGANTSMVSVSTSTSSTSQQVISYTATCSTAGSALVGTVTVNPVVTASISGNLSICAGATTSLTASGASAYRWSTGATTASISVNVAGTYSVTATSSAGCSNTAMATLVVSPLPTLTITSATICSGQTATLIASGVATYEWSTGAQTASIQVSATATQAYSVTGFTVQGCTSANSGTITVNGLPQINSISQSTACVGNVASLTVNATNTGSGTLEYSLNGGTFQISNSFTLNAPSSVTAAVVVRTQGSSCSATESVVVNCACQTPVSLTFVPTTLQTCAGSPVSFTVGVSGATSATLTTSGSGTLSQNTITNNGPQSISYRPSVADATAGSVTLTLTSADPDGVGACVADQVIRMLTINPALSLTVTSVSVCAGQVAELMASGGASTYRWSNGETTQGISVTATGAYSVTGLSAQGCSATAIGSVTIYPAIVISPTSLPVATIGIAYSQTITATGGVPAYSFTLTAGSLPTGLSLNPTTGVLSGTPTSAAPVSFTVRVTDSKSCSAVQPYSITLNGTPNLVLTKQVSKSRAKLGEVVSYTVTLANTGLASATRIVVSDTYTAGVSLVPSSVSTSAGSFTPGLSGGQWAIASLPAGATATLTFSASLTREGVSFNTASIPGQEVTVCTSVPIQICKGQSFEVQLSAPASYSRYQWYLTPVGATISTLVYDGTLNSFSATVPGEYQVVVNNGLTNVCPAQGCCPVVIEEVEVPSYTALVRNPSCVGGTSQPNGQITLVNLGNGSAQYVYQVSPGTSFQVMQAVPGSATAVPANGVVATGLLPGNYTIRVWLLINGEPSCPRDVTVAVVENCTCPAEICLPVVIKKIKSQGRTLNP